MDMVSFKFKKEVLMHPQPSDIGEGAGLQSLVVLGGAGPSRAGRGALAWEAFLWGQKEFTVRAGSHCCSTRCPLQPVGLCD